MCRLDVYGQALPLDIGWIMVSLGMVLFYYIIIREIDYISLNYYIFLLHRR